MSVSKMPSLKCNHLIESKFGKAEIQRFDVSKNDARLFNIKQLYAGHNTRLIKPGNYAKLVVDDTLWMSDTPAECNDHYEPLCEIYKRGGHVFIAGLGMGMIVSASLQCENVESVTVVELNSDVIELISPQIETNGKELTVINDDVWNIKARELGKFFSVVYLDIWPTLDTDNLVDYGRLKRKFARVSDKRICWAEDTLKYEKRLEYRGAW